MVAANILLVLVFTQGSSFGGALTALGFIGLLLFTIGFTFGFGTRVWVYAGESFPAHLRSLGSSAMLTSDLLANVVVGLVFLTMLPQLGGAGTFVVFGLLAIAAMAFVAKLAPETKGRSLEEIRQYWENGDAEWLRVLDVNVLGLVRVTRVALPALRESSHGAIVNTCSIAATAGLPNRAVYSASKGAVLSLTQAMAADLISDGIRVNAVNPGTADTPWVGRLLEAAPDPARERAALEARQPHGRLVAPAEVAHAVAYLASSQAGSTTATTLAVDGGMAGLRLRKAD